MKMKRVHVSFSQTIDIILYAPEDTNEDNIEKIANDLAMDNLRDWDHGGWNVAVGMSSDVTIPDEQLKASPVNAYGYRKCLCKQLDNSAALVLSDSKDDFVNACDASWWIVEETK